MIYQQILFENIPSDVTYMLIAQLSVLEYEGFEEDAHNLKAFIPQLCFNQDQLDDLCRRFGVSCSVSLLPDVNWNHIWEANFQPVTVDDFCTIRADFHAPATATKHEIVITPKMSFGTGHHPTTYMMIRQMGVIDFVNRSVMDFGTGTGVLAILAEKLGAANVLATDNDDWCIENAGENLLKNHTKVTQIIKADTVAATDRTFDVILANITRNIILDNFPFFVSRLSSKGVLLLSGLLVEDEAAIMNEAAASGFSVESRLLQDKWICLKLFLL